MERHDDVFEFQCSVYDLYNPREHHEFNRAGRNDDIDDSSVFDDIDVYDEHIDLEYPFLDHHQHHRCAWEYHVVIHHDHRRADDVTRRPNDDDYPIIADTGDFDNE